MRPVPFAVSLFAVSFFAVCLAGGEALLGCSPAPPPSASAHDDATLLLDVGGSGGDATSTFDVKGRAVAIDYRLNRMPTRGEVSFVLERSVDDGLFERVTSVSQPVEDSLVGSQSIPLLPGRYRIRVEADVAWSAKIYEKKS